MKRILIIGKTNSSISQMLHGWMKYYCSKDADVYSCGLRTEKINIFASKAMMDAVIDITAHKPELIEIYKGQNFDFIIATSSDITKEIKDCFPNQDIQIKPYEAMVKENATEEEILNYFKKLRDNIEEDVFDFVNENIKNLMPPGL